MLQAWRFGQHQQVLLLLNSKHPSSPRRTCICASSPDSDLHVSHDPRCGSLVVAGLIHRHDSCVQYILHVQMLFTARVYPTSSVAPAGRCASQLVMP